MEFRGQSIAPGEHLQTKIPISRLPTGTLVDMPLHILRGPEAGPTLLLTAALHGDETNGTETLRRLLRKGVLAPARGTVMVAPIVNVYGFLHQIRDLPDGKDLNRSFPGSPKGSLASRLAHVILSELVTPADYIVDLHTGGASRTNYPQVRCDFSREGSLKLARAFRAPFLIDSPEISKSFRKAAATKGKSIIVYEGGESLRLDEVAIRAAMLGIQRVMAWLGMSHLETEPGPSIELNQRTWLRASISGLFVPFVESGKAVSKGQVIAHIGDPGGNAVGEVKARFDGYVLGLNNHPVVHAGDALIHLAAPD